MRLGHALIQNGAAVSANQVSETIAEQSVVLKGDQRIAVLPAFSDVFRAAVLAPADGQFCGHSRFPFLCSVSLVIKQIPPITREVQGKNYQFRPSQGTPIID